MFHFRKFIGVLALTIALVQVVTAVPVYAEETTKKCWHVECTNYDPDHFTTTCEECWTGTPSSWRSNDNGIDHAYSYTCNGCGYQDVFDEDCYFEDGECKYCGQKQKYTTCMHENCKNVTTTTVVCDVCLTPDWSEYREKIDDNTHKTVIKYECCDTISSTIDEHDFSRDEDECYLCGYVVSGCDESVSGNSTGMPAIPKPTVPIMTEKMAAEMIAEQQAAAFEAAQKKVVTFESGRQVKTEIDGVYEIAGLSGTAVATSKADVQKAVGLTDEQIAAGTNVSIFMGNLCDKAAKEALTNAAAASGKHVLNMFVSDMYTITLNGQITKINTTETPINIVIGLPKHAVDKNITYSVIGLTADEKFVEMPDKDADAGTITIDTSVFGKCAIVHE